jgi:predicted anti-sigma-YlaC factor YlaD
MKVIGCKTFSREIDELGLGQEPEARMRSHLLTCASCRSFYEDRLKLRQMISDLGTVAAPGDFDFRTTGE